MSAAGTPAPTPNPLTSFVSGLEAWFKARETQVVQFVDTFLPQIATDIEVGLEDLIGIAGQAVLSQAAGVISGTEKFGNAVTSVVQTVEASGKTVAIQTAQMAVQQAVITAQNVAANAAPPPAA